MFLVVEPFCFVWFFGFGFLGVLGVVQKFWERGKGWDLGLGSFFLFIFVFCDLFRLFVGAEKSCVPLCSWPCSEFVVSAQGEWREEKGW